MQKDFHYYGIAVLARAAGFKSEDALTIAYASQYVDDSTESELFNLDVTKEELKFDPVRSSYFGLEALLSITWSAQKRVWIPFHFLSPKPFTRTLFICSEVLGAGLSAGNPLWIPCIGGVNSMFAITSSSLIYVV